MPVSDIKIADDLTDKTEATDALIVDNRIALRVRRPEQIRYADQFTIRTTTAYGTNEWSKVERGLVHFMLYAFAADPDSADLQRWTLIDLRKLERSQGVETIYGGGSFLAFDLAECRQAIVAEGGRVAAPLTAAQERQLWGQYLERR